MQAGPDTLMTAIAALPGPEDNAKMVVSEVFRPEISAQLTHSFCFCSTFGEPGNSTFGTLLCETRHLRMFVAGS